MLRVAAAKAIKAFLAAALALALAQMSPLAPAQEPGGREILDRVENLLWGKTLQGEFEMSIASPRWQRTLGMRKSICDCCLERPTHGR